MFNCTKNKESIPQESYKSEHIYTSLYEAYIAGFFSLLHSMQIGGILVGPTIKDEERRYGQLGFTRVKDDGWIVALQKEFTGSANISIWIDGCKVVDTDGLDESGEIIQTILTTKEIERSACNTVLLQVKISADRIPKLPGYRF